MARAGLPHYSQLHTMFTAKLAKSTFTQTDDSTDCKLTRRRDIASLQVTYQSGALEELSMVRDVIIDGKLVMQNRKLLTLDEKLILEKAKEWQEKIADWSECR